MAVAPKPSSSRIPRPRGFDLLLLSALLFYFILLRFFPGAFDRWPLTMHYTWRDKHIFSHGLASLVPLLAGAALLFALATRLRRTSRWVVPGLFAAALILQWSLSFLDAGLSARRISSTLLDPTYGHSEFPVIAFGERSPVDLAREYEIRCVTDRRFNYSLTKPPGQLVFYTLTAHAYRTFAPPDFFDALARRAGFYNRGPLTGYGAFTTILFSVLACLAVPAVARASRLQSRRAASWAALAWTLCPAAMLMTMHLDAVLYPLLSALALLCALSALRRGPVYAFVAGLSIALALYVSFSLVFLLPTTLLIWSTQPLRAPARARFAGLLILCSLLALGLLAGWAFLYLTLNFDLPTAWRRSMFFHIRWRRTTGLVGLQDTLRNFVEFALWLGLPTSLIYLKVLTRALKKLIRPIGPIRPIRPVLRPWELFALLYPFLLFAISVFGHTIAETGRLWIPLMIPMLIPIARELSATYRRAPWFYAALAFSALLLAKNFHDF